MAFLQPAAASALKIIEKNIFILPKIENKYTGSTKTDNLPENEKATGSFKPSNDFYR